MADGDEGAEGEASSAAAGRRTRRWLWAGLGVLLVGVGLAVGAVVFGGGGDNNQSKVTAAKSVATTSTTAAPTTTTIRANPPAVTAAQGGAATPTNPPRTTVAPTATTLPLPTVVSASVTPTYVICPRFGGETTVTLTWDTANATNVAIGIIQADGSKSGQTGGQPRDSHAYTIPCNGKQQKLFVLPYRNTDPVTQGADVYVFVGEGIEGT